MTTAPQRPRYWWLAPVLGGVVLFTGAAGLVARAVYQGGDGSAGSGALPMVLPSAATSVPASEEPGSPTVRLTDDAANYPLGGEVRTLLQTYFDSINSKSYDEWRSVVTDARQQGEPRSVWRADYRTTTDGSIDVYRIEQAPQGGLRVLLTFTSEQDVANAPPDLPSPCIHWQVVYPLTVENGAWKLDVGISSASPQRQRCS
ncbi:MAG TPA: hypothetical protein VG317_00085 [Pseudonocardiaceae bacterium]|nr:hypothetical protein [Pseudonocardiaceae bacterium]